MKDIDYFSALKESQEKFPENRRIRVKLKECPELIFKNILFEYYMENTEFRDFEIFIDGISLKIKPFSTENIGKKFPKTDCINILLDKRLQINIFYIFDFIKFLD